MSIKNFFQPNKHKVLLSLFLFGVVFFIPYFKATPAPGTEELITGGHYPLIFIFLMSLVVIMEVFTGQFIMRDWLLLLSFFASFILVYLFACSVAYLIGRKKLRSLTADSAAPASLGNSYVVDLDKNNK